jgi:hypothetical protein
MREVKSMKFVFDKMVADKVNQESLALEYEGRVRLTATPCGKLLLK